MSLRSGLQGLQVQTIKAKMSIENHEIVTNSVPSITGAGAKFADQNESRTKKRPGSYPGAPRILAIDFTL